MAITKAIKEAIWLQGLLENLGLVQEHINVYCDIQSAIHLENKQVYYACSKHIDVRFTLCRKLLMRERFFYRKTRLQRILQIC